MKPEYTQHALLVLEERQIDASWVERTLTRPALREADPGDCALERFYAIVPERGERVLRVIADTSSQPWRVISAFFDRNMKGKL